MKRFNIIDAVIVVVILAGIAAVGFLKFNGGSTEASKMLVTLELTEKYEGFSENVVIGDSVTEKVQNVQIGKVVGVEAKPCKKNSYDRVTGAPIEITVPEREDVYITMEVDQTQDVAVGKNLSVITKHFAGAGYVTGLEAAE